MPEKKDPTPLEILQQYNEGHGNQQPIDPMDAENFADYVNSIQPIHDAKKCDKKHCPVCGRHYMIMAFNHPGPCRELCRKEEAGDDWPSRSSMISGA